MLLRACSNLRRSAAPGLLAALLPLLAGCAPGVAGQRSVTLLFGEVGEHPGRLRQPRAVAFSPDGRELFILDRTHRVQVFDRQGKFLREWPTPVPPNIPRTISNPRGITVGPDGRVWLANTHAGELIVYEPDGTELFRIGRPGRAPGEFAAVTGVALDPEGNIWTCEYGAIEHGTSQDRLQKFDPDGKPLLTVGRRGTGPGEFERPQALAIDEEGRVYVADGVNHRVQVFSPEGELLHAWGRRGRAPGELIYPYDVALDRHGRVYVAEYGNSRVSVFTREGEFLMIWGGPGREPGEFNQPWGVSVDPAGNVYVADTQNYRIQRFAPLPAP